MKTIADYMKKGWVKILRTGEFTDRRKRTHIFDGNRLQRIADNYQQPLNFSLAPITPTHDAKPTTPNLGKIERLKRVGQFLLAKPAKVVKDMVTVLKDIGYKYVSASLNPNDTINHLALVPNPAVSGLGEFPETAMNFSKPEEDTDTIDLLIEFSSLEEEEQEETETEDTKNKENLNIDEKEETIMFKKKKKPDEDQSKEQDIETADDSPEENDGGDGKVDFAAALDEATKRAESAEEKADALTAAVNKMQQERLKKEVADFCDSLKPGAVIPKFLPGVKRMLTVLAGLPDTYDFSDGKGEKETTYEFAKSLLSSLEPQIPLDPLKPKGTTGDDDDIEFSGDVDEEDLERDKKARAIMKEKECTYEDALTQV